MTGQLLIDPAEDGGHTRFVFRLGGRSGAGRASRRPRGPPRVPRHAQVRPPAPDRGRPGSPAWHLGPDAWRGDWDAAYLEQPAARPLGPAQGLSARPAAPGRHRQHLRRRDPLVDGAVAAAGGRALSWRSRSAAWPTRSAPDCRRGCGCSAARCPTSSTPRGGRGASRTGCRPTAGKARSAGVAGASWRATVVGGRGTAYCPGLPAVEGRGRRGSDAVAVQHKKASPE